MGINSNLNPKKIIGRLGRKYGGRPFQVVRKFFYDSAALMGQAYEISYLRRGRYAPSHRDSRFLKKYYPQIDGPEHSENKKLNKAGKIICFCDGRRFHGGPTDRLRGILTTYREAKKRGIPFFISWSDPFPLEDYLVPASFDWRIPKEEIVYGSPVSFPVIIEDETDLQSRWRMWASMDLKFSQLHVYSNADNARGEYRELFNEVFRPSPLLENAVQGELEKIGRPYWAFTFRFLNLLGDFREWARKSLSGSELDEFLNRVTAEFLNLINEVPENHAILVTSDSRKFLDLAKTLDPRIHVVAGDVKNIDLMKGEFKDAWLKTFVDQQLIMRAERVYLMRTDGMYKSGFPRFAAEVGGAEFIDHSF